MSKILFAIVNEHGIDKVERTLNRIRKSEKYRKEPSTYIQAPSEKIHDSDSVRPKKRTFTALEYVSKMDVDSDVKELLEEVASQFDNKQFLPTFGEVKNYCTIHGIKIPTSSSRWAAIPRVFKQISKLTPQEIRSIVQSNSFSGPAQLAPIADAIRRRSKQRTNIDENEEGLLTEKHEMVKKEIVKPQIPTKF